LAEVRAPEMFAAIMTRHRSVSAGANRVKVGVAKTIRPS